MKFNAIISIIWAICSVISLVIGEYHVAFLEGFIALLCFEKYFLTEKSVK
jgi:hypothetical protein